VHPQHGLEHNQPFYCKPPQRTASAAIYSRRCSSDAEHTRYVVLAHWGRADRGGSGLERAGVALRWRAFTSVRA
jgi:hypothetical protein